MCARTITFDLGEIARRRKHRRVGREASRGGLMSGAFVSSNERQEIDCAACNAGTVQMLKGGALRLLRETADDCEDSCRHGNK